MNSAFSELITRGFKKHGESMGRRTPNTVVRSPVPYWMIPSHSFLLFYSNEFDWEIKETPNSSILLAPGSLLFPNPETSLCSWVVAFGDTP